jgi:peptidoglycan/xylan/chitin deacetylase (PgdA/CDA1 family)
MRQARRVNRVPVVVLFYHRVADSHSNPWTIDCAGFSRHLRWLKKHYELISLAEVQRRVRDGNDRPAVSITFDDGYSENCDFALPLLIREQVPCTYFVTTDNILSGSPFPHDVALRQPLPVNTVEQLRTLAAAGVDIGCHTRTHADLGKLSDHRALRDEIVSSRDELSAAIGAPVRYFAFPYGLHANLNEDACQIAREAGYEGICSAYGGANTPGDDAFHLQRMHGDPDLIRLKNNVTLDPRKRHTERFQINSAPTTNGGAVAATALDSAVSCEQPKPEEISG